jgi:hypothetical protein
MKNECPKKKPGEFAISISCNKITNRTFETTVSTGIFSKKRRPYNLKS